MVVTILFWFKCAVQEFLEVRTVCLLSIKETVTTPPDNQVGNDQ
jgi:hypothetical protein